MSIKTISLDDEDWSDFIINLNDLLGARVEKLKLRLTSVISQETWKDWSSQYAICNALNCIRNKDREGFKIFGTTLEKMDEKRSIELIKNSKFKDLFFPNEIQLKQLEDQ